MILSRSAEGLTVVRQPDHGRQTGAFAAAWGSDEVPADDTRTDSVRLAATHHDDGWGTWELYPTLDPATGQPVQFLELTPFEHVPLYRAAIERMAAADPFAGLLVSMHGAGLYNARYGTFQLIELDLSDEERAIVEELLADMAALQVALAARSGAPTPHGHPSEDPAIRATYLRLQVWDRLSLQYCYFASADGAIGPLPLGAGATGQLRCHNAGHHTLALDPWPFQERRHVFAVPSVTVADRPYPTPDAFLEAVLSAPVRTLECTAVPLR